MIEKEFPRIFGITLKPVAGLAETKTVPPGIHVGHDAHTPCTLNVVCKQNLQVAYGRLFKIVAARIPIEAIATLTIHTNDVAGFVEE